MSPMPKSQLAIVPSQTANGSTLVLFPLPQKPLVKTKGFFCEKYLALRAYIQKGFTEILSKLEIGSPIKQL